MIRFHELALRRGGKPLFAGASLSIYPGFKVGVLGRNGTGKSSLLALIRGELAADAGELERPDDLVIAHVAQATPAVDRAAIDYVIDGDRALRAAEAAIEEAQAVGEGERLARLHGELDALDGWSARARAARLLAGLGFAESALERPVAEFSGGWRMRLNLAQALMCPSDLLLLDEPTNHLDFEAVLWLERWLEVYRGTLLLIAHDREFLDAVADHVLHLDGRTARLYRGNVSAFERRRALELAEQQALRERQQAEVRHIRAFVDRFRAKASKARQAQSRLKALERMEVVAAAHVDTPFRFTFPEPEALPNPLIKLEDAEVGYGERTVLGRLRLTIEPGLRFALLGVNGAGKSTLIRLLAGELEPRAGARTPAAGARIGYFAQHQLEALDLEASPLVSLRRLAPEAPEQRLLDYLGGFGFRGERVAAAAHTFSGGERARLALALLVWQAPNLLLLDEPTNHLDMEMRDALAMALQAYAGAVVLVSHDRSLLRAVSDELLLVADGTVRRFEGDLDAYRLRVMGRDRSSFATRAAGGRAQRPSAVSEGAAEPRRARRQSAAEHRREQAPVRARLARLEDLVARLEAERERLDQALADPALYGSDNGERLRDLAFERARVSERIETLEKEWLEIVTRDS